MVLVWIDDLVREISDQYINQNITTVIMTTADDDDLINTCVT